MKTTGKILLVLMAVTFVVSYAFAQEARRTVKITAMEGDVSVKLAGGKWTPAVLGADLGERDILKTKANSTATLNVDGNGETATVDLSPNSEVMMAELFRDAQKGTQRTLLDLTIGKIMIKAKKLHSEEERFEVKTPTTIVGVRGTTFEVDVEAVE